MYNPKKNIKKAEMIIIFLEEKTEINPQSFTILNQTITITKDISKYQIHLKDFIINI